MHKYTVWITGASGAVGGALALAYAAPGVKLILQGRSGQLIDLAMSCRSLGACVEEFFIDLNDVENFQKWAKRMALSSPPDLLIANAGVNINISSDAEGEQWEDIKNLLNVNIISCMALVNAVLPGMRQRGSGQIALMSSLAAFFGLPMTPAYSASKAAIKAYGEGLRGWLAPEGIWVNVIMPGYISSPMCDSMPGPKPFMLKPEEAAVYIKKKLSVNSPRICFPFPLNLATWLLAAFPALFSHRILWWMGYRA